MASDNSRISFVKRGSSHSIVIEIGDSVGSGVGVTGLVVGRGTGVGVLRGGSVVGVGAGVGVSIDCGVAVGDGGLLHDNARATENAPMSTNHLVLLTFTVKSNGLRDAEANGASPLTYVGFYYGGRASHVGTPKFLGNFGGDQGTGTAVESVSAGPIRRRRFGSVL